MLYKSSHVLNVSVGLVGLALTGCSTPVDTDVTFNERPTAEITSHVTGALLVEGDSVLLRGRVADSDDQTASLVATWHNGTDKYCASAAPDSDGMSECSITVGSSGFTVVLNVEDDDGASGSVSVQIDVTPTDAPVVSLLSPIDMETYYAGAYVAFEGTVSDTEDSPETLNVWFESSATGDLGLEVTVTDKGLVSAIGSLAEGSQTVTMFASDSTGKSSSDSVVVRVSEENVPPLCQIDLPTADSVTVSGESVTLQGLVSDANVDPEDLSVIWRSDIDGQLGTSTPDGSGIVTLVAKKLSVGTHTIKLTATDDVGDNCVVESPHVVGTLPVITLDSPLSGDVITLADSVSFIGVVSDEQDNSWDIDLEWSSDVDGVFSYQGAGPSGAIDFDFSTLSAGPHTITVLATDSDGLTQTMTVDIVINEMPTIPSISVGPDPADSTMDLVAAMDVESTDPEGATVVHIWSWLRDGVDSGASETETLLAENTSKGEVWTAVLTPNDGHTDGPAATASITIDNGAPDIVSVIIEPDPSYTDDTLSVVIDAADPDSDSLTYTYSWTVDGVEAPTAGSTLRGTSFFDKDQLVSVSVTATDGFLSSPTVTSDIMTVQNSAPVISSAAMWPNSIDASTEITTSYQASDDDDDVIEVGYVWYVDGIDVGVVTDTLAPEYFAVQQEIWVEITPFDGTDYGVTVASSVGVVGNSAPTVDSVSVDPTEAWTNDTLTAVVSTSDADGDTVTVTYQWRNNNIPISGATLETLDGTLDFDRDDSISVSVTPDDGTTTGSPSSSTAVVITNTAPVVETLDLGATEFYTLDTVAPTVTIVDDDDDSTSREYSWVVDGVEAATSGILNGAIYFDKGQSVYLSVIPSDGDLSGDAVTSEIFTVLNSVPVIATVDIFPASPSTDDTLSVNIVATDDDGEAINYAYTWFVDGADIGVSTDTLEGGDWFGAGASISVEVTADDGDDTSEPFASVAVSVGNSAPVLTSVTITPDPAFTNDVLVSNPIVDDDDGDTVTFTYSWTVNGVVLVTETSASLDGSVNFDVGDRIRLTVVPNDGTVSGASMPSSVVEIQDSLPTVVSATLDTTTVYTNDTVSVSATASDADGDSVSLEYQWFVDGAVVPISAPSLSGAAWFDKGQTIYCEVNATGDAGDGVSVTTASVVIANSVPVVTSVVLSPEQPGSDETVLSAVTSSDVDGDSVSYSYQWTVDGTVVPTTGDSLSGTWFVDGQDIVVTVTPNDGTEDGLAVVSNTVVSVNAVPEVTSISLTPSVATTDTLVRVITTTNDADGDTVSLTYAWYVDGVREESATTDTLNGALFFAKGQQIYAQVTPTDGKDFGAPVTSSVITIANTDPVISSVTLSPSSPYTTDNIAVDIVSDDDDGDSITVNFQWFVDGVEQAFSGPTLANASFEKNQTMRVTMTPNDSESDGATISSASVLVVNTPPNVLSASLSPASPSTDEVVTVVVTGDDADGDALSYDYNWFVGGVSTGVTTDSLDGAVWFEGGQEVYCQVTAFDGTQYGTPFDSDAVTIGNSPPSVTSVTVSPNPGRTNDILTASVTTNDDDGDAVTVSYRWKVDGLVIPSETSSTIDGSAWFTKGQSVIAEATPNDGIDDGTRVSATAVTIVNTQPAISVVTLSPLDADAQSTITAAVTASDADTDALTYTYEWTVDGVIVGDSTATLAGLFSRGEAVSVAAIAYDGETDSAVVVSAALTVGNAAPTVTDVSFSSDSPGTDDVLVATVTSNDVDGDAVTLTYDWLVDGTSTGVSGDSLDGAVYFARGQSITVMVTPTDADITGASVTAGPVIVANSAPVLVSVDVSPLDPTTNEVLVATTVGMDPDEDSVTFTYRWLVDGVESVEVGSTLDGASYFARDQIVSVEATPWDDAVAGDSVSSNAVTVANSAPVISSVVLNPTEPGTDDTLTVNIVSEDADADDTFFHYTWTVNGAEVAETGETLDGSVYFGQGDVVAVSVAPDDATDIGASVESAAVTVGNSPAVVHSVSLTPSTAYTDDVIAAVVDATDADSDSISFEYSWTVDGVVVAGEVSSTLSGIDHFDKGQNVTVSVTPFDGIEYSVVAMSSPLVVQNTTPSVTSVTLDPTSPETSGLVSVVFATNDLDGDVVTASYRWFVNGASVASTGSTLDGVLYFDRDDIITVEVTPNDGDDDGYPLTSAAVTVGNTAPVITAVDMAPSAIGTNDVITVVVSATDDDNDAITYSYEWTVDGLVVGNDSSLDGTVHFDVGQGVVVTATPMDGLSTGNAVASAAVIVGNSVPVVSAVTLSPNPAFTNDTITAIVTATDSDGESISLTYAWYVDGVLLFGETASALDGIVHFDRDQTVSASVTPSDGTDNGGTFSSDALTVSNTVPVLDSLSVAPTSPDTVDTITATVTTSDDDGDAVSVIYAWTVDGVLAAETGATLDGGLYFDRDQVVGLTATPTDGTDNGNTIAAGDVQVLNTAPVVASIIISPSSPGTDDTVSAFVSASDLDNDTLTYTYTWLVDGVDVGASGYTLSGTTHFSAGQSIQVSVVGTDGSLNSNMVTSGVSTVANTLPTVSNVTLSPDPAVTDDTIVATVVASDPDGDSVALAYSWAINGATIAESSDTLVDTGLINKGDTVTVTVSPSDAAGTGSSFTSSGLVIGNSAPQMTSVSLTPLDPTVASTLTASVTATDADSDGVTYTYEWIVDGTTMPETGSTLEGGTYFARGDDVSVSVTPNDGSISGAALVSSIVVVGNTAPLVSSVLLTPVTPTTNDTLTASVASSDIDGDSVTLGYEWSVNGAVVAGQISATLDGASHFDSGDTVSVMVMPSDDADTGTAVTSASVMVGNTAPEVTLVVVSPSVVDTIGTLTATPTTNDDDGDVVSVSYSWTVDGITVGETSATISGVDYFDRDQIVGVTATPNDGTATGSSLTSATITVSNTAPIVSSVTISPASVGTNDTLTAMPTASDLDNDSISYTYTWYVEGVASAQTGSSLDGTTEFSKGQSVLVAVTPTDGTDAGGMVFSDSITIGNSAPSAPVVAINPGAPVAAADDLVCSVASGGVDPDGDTVTHSASWTVDGAAFVSPFTTTFANDSIAAADTCQTSTWTCTVTATDGTDSQVGSVSVDVQSVFCGTYDLALGGRVIDGSMIDGQWGVTMANTGDIDADGADDLLIGAPFAGAGTVSVVTLTDAASWSGEVTGDQLGAAVAAGEDLNGNGTSDFVVGAPGYDDIVGDEGVVYVIQSDALAGSVVSAAYAVIYGDVSGAQLGASVVVLADADFDGQTELLIGAPGSDTVYGFDTSLFGDYDVSLDASLVITGGTGDGFGSSVVALGDVTGDGVIDFAVTAPGYGGGFGAVYVFSGDATGTLDTTDALAILTGTVDISIVSVDSAYDLDNDGNADMVIGAPIASGGPRACVVYGPVTGSHNVEDVQSAIVSSESANFGHSVRGVGDVNADGFADILVTSDSDAWLMHGPLSGSVTIPDAVFTNAVDAIAGPAGDYSGTNTREVVFGLPSNNSNIGRVQVMNP